MVLLLKVKERTILAILIFFIVSLGIIPANFTFHYAFAWSNGGYSENPSDPDYGTHDWIAEHALDWLSPDEKHYLDVNLDVYLYGTELPDNPNPDDGIGDTTKHHIYFSSDGTLVDDSAALRAQEEYNKIVSYLKTNHLEEAAKTAGIMSHYISDVAVLGHVMGSGTDWGSEEHHSDYENYVNTRTNNYIDDFNIYLSFDGSLDNISAYEAAINLAYDTTFDIDGNLTCIWMDNNYDLSDPTFKARCGESLNLAVNYLTDVLHTLYIETMQDETDQNNPTINVVINEVELNPSGNDNYKSVEEWIELFNPTADDVDISGWMLSTTHGRTVTITVPQGTTITANGYYVYGRGSQWLDNEDESILLQDSEGTEIDRTPKMSDDDNDARSWQRYPNGQDSWRFHSSTKGSSNGGEAPKDDTPPTIADVDIEPSSGPLGTIFTISADVSDPSGVDKVVAYVQRPDETDIATITLTDPEDDGTFSGSWDSAGGSIGKYWVDLVARDILDNSGEEDNAASFTVVEEKKEPPKASFTYFPTTNLSIMVTIQFEDTSTDPDGTIVSWSWDFGDNIISNDQNPTYRYIDKGTYTVKLTVTDNDGLKDIKTREIAIQNLAPTAKFMYSPETPTVGEIVNFMDQSEDLEGRRLLYSWDFGDGFTSTERSPGYTYEEPGTYTVKLTVTDDEGAKGTSSITITVTKLSSAITLFISLSEVTISTSLTISGSISPSILGITVTLTYTKPDGSTFTRTTTTGSDGAYSDSYTPVDAGSWSVKASWEGDAAYSGATSQTLEFNVVEAPPPTGILKIIVQDENGNPITGARVSSTSQPSGQQALSGSSGTDGSATFVDAKTGDYTIQTSRSGYETASKSVMVIGGETTTLRIELKEQFGTLKIVIKDNDGSSVSGASITSTSTPSGQSALSGTSGSDGLVTFGDVKVGVYTFEASKSEYVTKSGSMNAKAGKTVELTITLEKEAKGGAGIPGFPYESIVLGLVLGAFMLWMLQRRR